MKLIPLLDRVLIEQHQAQKTISGFAIPTSEQNKPQTGTVIRAAEDTGFEPGEEIVFDKFSNGMAVEENGKELLLISTKHIFAKIKSNGSD